MDTGKRILRYFTFLGVALLQLIATQVVTFLFSLLLPGMGDFPQSQPLLFVVLLGVAYTVGIFLVGWLALKVHWVNGRLQLLVRLVAVLVGAYLPLFAALVIYRTLEPGNPFFFIAALTGIFGFHLPGWFRRA